MILLIAFMGSIAAATPPEPDGDRRIAFKRLDSSDGLSGDSVYCMLQDRLGYLWLGTFSGLSRYDGSRIIAYRPVPGDPESLPSSLVFDLHEDAAGTLWIATDGGGLARYSRDSDAFERFAHDGSDPASLASDRVFAVADDPYGWVWVGTADAGLERLDPVARRFYHYGEERGLGARTVRAVLCDEGGTLWAGTTGGLFRYDRDADRFAHVAGLGASTVRAIAAGAEGIILVGTEGAGAYALDTGTLLATRLGLGPGSERLHVRALAIDGRGRVWAGTDDQGLHVLDAERSPHSLRSVPGDERSIGHDAIRSIIVDRSGLVWVGTRGGGAAVHNPRSSVIRLLAADGGLPAAEARQALEARDGTVWLGTDGGGLVRLRKAPGRGLPRIERVYRAVPGDEASLPSDKVVCLAEDGLGGIWVGTDGAGLARLDPATGRFERYAHDPGRPGSLGGNTVWALLVDADGTLWAGLEGAGLARLDTAEKTFASYAHEPGVASSLGGNSVRALLEDSAGRLWVGLWDGGLCLWDKAAGKALARYGPSGAPGSLSDSSVICLLEDSHGRLWVGTGGSGLNRLVYDSDASWFEHISVADGLAGDDIVGLIEDERGYVWSISGRGVSRVSVEGSPGNGSSTIRSWGPGDGFQERFSQNAWARLSDGSILLGGPEGVNAFMPADLEDEPPPPPVLIADVAIVAHPEADDAERSRRTRTLRAFLNQGVITLRPEDAALALDFAVLDFVDPSRNRLSAVLLGGPTERMELGSLNRAVIGGLAPGEYELRVAGASSGGVWNRAGASLTVIVAPPFWRTPAFIAFSVLAALTVAGLAIRSRTIALERRAELMRTLSMHLEDAREEERTTAAREVHDELGQLLTAAKLDLAWLRTHPPAPEEVGSRVGEAMATVDAAIDSVKRISTRLRPKALDTLTLSEALRWQLEEFARRSGLECSASIEPSPEGLVPETATTVFRVFQELLTNIGRHAEARRVDVGFSCDGEALRLVVRDDGKGMPPGATDAPESLGIVGMRERVRHAGGLLSIETPAFGLDVGTSVTVEIPLAGRGRRRVAGG